MDTSPEFETFHYISRHGVKTITPDIDLGAGRMRVRKGFGIHRALWDFCFGYVSGFPIRDISYYVLTRSLSQRIWHRTYFRENPNGEHCGGWDDALTGETQWCPKCSEHDTRDSIE